MSENLELTFRDLLSTIRTAQARAASNAAAGAMSSVSAAQQSEIAAHALARFGVHGVGPGFFIAKTANPTGLPRWNEIEGRPAWIEQQINPATLELRADQITSGVFDINRLPIATSGNSDPTALVRADDPRLTLRHWTIETSEPLYAGQFVTTTPDGRCRRASAASWTMAAIGYVVDDYGTGQQAEIFPFGTNDHVYLPLVVADNYMWPLYLSVTPGEATVAPPLTPGAIVQRLGLVTAVLTSTVARAAIVIHPYEEVL